MKMYKRFLLVILFFVGSLQLFILRAQSIEVLLQKSLNDSSQEMRLQAADSVQIILQEILLKNPHASFEHLYNFSALSSEEDAVRVFTWCVPLEQGFYKYFGLIQTITDSQRLFVLNDQFTHEESTGFEKLTSEKWLGALYSKLITSKWKKETFYTLLGWDGNNSISDVKVIEILYFDSIGNPCFGKEVFDTCSLCQRYLLQYRNSAHCSLRYERQSGKYNDRTISENMIVFDHLAPENQYFEGMKSMYIPTETFDAFFWKNGQWIFIGNIDARNY